MGSEGEWKEDSQIERNLKKYIAQNLKIRSEVLDFVKQDFPHNTWSIGSLDRRLRH